MQPDVIIIGDSHTAALRAGCEALGLQAALLYVSGNHWHTGCAELHPEFGLHFPNRPVLQHRLRQVRRVLPGGALFTRDVPVIASFGYHLGRLVPPFTGWGHTTDAKDFAQRDDALHASTGLMAAYIGHYRDKHFGILAHAATLCDLTVVAPPMVQADATAHAFACHITARLIAMGVQVHDARKGQAYKGVTLAHDLLSEDGVHGNAAYGTGVIRKLLQKGLIRKPEGAVSLVA